MEPPAKDYVNARILEASAETTLALGYLNRGLVRNAAGKAWKAALATCIFREGSALYVIQYFSSVRHLF
ncbi:PaREP1 family protein [Pyrobaculum sp.]|uniref:PaREP1 family protein n=1 Tax=Pyrobaculum sp. TaxID=2004705 RepID=UPI003D13F54E